MGFLVGLLFGLGGFLCLFSGRHAVAGPSRGTKRLRAFLAEAGPSSFEMRHVALLSIACGVVPAAAVGAVSATWSVAAVFGAFGTGAPWMWLNRRIQRRRCERRDLWPYVIDDLGSGIRAGLSLPEAVAAVAERGPEPLRPAFEVFAARYRSSGAFTRSLRSLGDELADPVADRVIEALLLAREVGGTDVGRLLRSLSQALREDGRARGEIEARQSWTVNGARLAVAAPWAVLLLLAVRGSSIRVYDKPGGIAILAVGGGLSLAAYLIMRRIGRLPIERRSVSAAG